MPDPNIEWKDIIPLIPEETELQENDTFVYYKASVANLRRISVANMPFGDEPPPPDTTPPTVIADLLFTPLTYSTGRLEFTPATDSSGVESYNVERVVDGVTTVVNHPIGDFTVVSGKLRLALTGLLANKLYAYRVQGIDGAEPPNIATFSNTSSDTTPDVPEPTDEVNVVMTGDSTVANAGILLEANRIHKTVQVLLPSNYTVVNAGVGGAMYVHPETGTNKDLIASAATYIDPLIVPGKLNFLTIKTFFNDSQTYTVTPEDVMAQCDTFCTARFAAGWDKVFVVVASPADYVDQSGYYQAKRLLYNDLLRANWQDFCSGLIDDGIDPVVGTGADTANGALYLDRLHPNGGFNTGASPYYARAFFVANNEVNEPTTPTGVTMQPKPGTTTTINIKIAPAPDDYSVTRRELRINGGEFVDEIWDIGLPLDNDVDIFAAGTDYEIEVRAVNEGEFSDWTKVFNVATYSGSGSTPDETIETLAWINQWFQDLAKAVPATVNGEFVKVAADAMNAFDFIHDTQMPVYQVNAAGNAPGTQHTGGVAPYTKLIQALLANSLRVNWTIGYVTRQQFPLTDHNSVMIMWGSSAIAASRRQAIHLPFSGHCWFASNGGAGTAVGTFKNVCDNAPHGVIMTMKDGLLSIIVDEVLQVQARPALVDYGANPQVALGGNTDNFDEEGYGFVGDFVFANDGLTGVKLNNLIEHLKNQIL